MLEGLAWIEKNNPQGFCVTFARELGEIEMLSRFVDDPSRAEMVPDLIEDEALREEIEAEEEDAIFEGRFVHVGSCGGWAFALEDGLVLYAITRPEILRRVSVGTIAIAIANTSWNGMMCSYAKNGVLIATWDNGMLSFPEQVDDREDRGHLLSRAKDVWTEDQSTWEGAVALAEAMGVSLDRESVAEKPLFRTWVDA